MLLLTLFISVWSIVVIQTLWFYGLFTSVTFKLLLQCIWLCYLHWLFIYHICSTPTKKKLCTMVDTTDIPWFYYCYQVITVVTMVLFGTIVNPLCINGMYHGTFFHHGIHGMYHGIYHGTMVYTTVHIEYTTVHIVYTMVHTVYTMVEKSTMVHLVYYSIYHGTFFCTLVFVPLFSGTLIA